MIQWIIHDPRSVSRGVSAVRTNEKGRAKHKVTNSSKIIDIKIIDTKIIDTNSYNKEEERSKRQENKRKQ